MADDRWKTAKDFIYARVKEKAGFQKLLQRSRIVGL